MKTKVHEFWKISYSDDYSHETEQDAIDEAEQLAAANPGVLYSIGHYYTGRISAIKTSEIPLISRVSIQDEERKNTAEFVYSGSRTIK